MAGSLADGCRIASGGSNPWMSIRSPFVLWLEVTAGIAATSMYLRRRAEQLTGDVEGFIPEVRVA